MPRRIAWRGASCWRSNRSRVAVGAYIVSALVFIGANVSAEPELILHVVAPGDHSDENPYPYPHMEVRADGLLPELQARDFVLTQVDLDPPLSVTATDVIPYARGDRPLALVILIQGTGRWMGNEFYAEDDGEVPSAGAFPGLPPALEVLATAGPEGSLAAVLVYGDGKVQARYEMGDIRKVDGSVLGAQKEYQYIIDAPLLTGLAHATMLLDGYREYRQCLVVVGRGVGEREDISEELQDRVEALTARGVEVYSIFYEAIPSGRATGQSVMKRIGSKKSYIVDSRDSFVIYARAIVEEINAQVVIRFPWCQDDRCLSSDGREHDFSILAQGEEAISTRISVPYHRVPEDEVRSFPWWSAGVGVAGVLGALIFVVRRRAR